MLSPQHLPCAKNARSMHDTICHAWSNAHQHPILTTSVTTEESCEHKDMYKRRMICYQTMLRDARRGIHCGNDDIENSMSMCACRKTQMLQTHLIASRAAAAAAHRRPCAAASPLPHGKGSCPHICRPAEVRETIASTCQMVGSRGITACKQDKERGIGRHRRARGGAAHSLRCQSSHN